MKTRLLVIAFAVCLIASPAMADLYSFSFDALQTTWTSGTKAFTADKTTGNVGTIGSLKRWQPPLGTALFNWQSNVTGDFYLSMTLSSIVSTAGSESADATGTFTIEDTDAVFDTITGDITGQWTRNDIDTANEFSGVLSDVVWTDNGGAGDFDGHGGSAVSMLNFPTSPPGFLGTIIQLTASAPWFDAISFDRTGGSVDATIVPVPAAVVLGILGLGVAGIKLRKYA